MNIPYRTQRVLNRVGTVLLVLLVVGIAAWLCWVLWLQRYVVYTDEGASLDFSQSSNDVVGEEAIPPVAEANVSIFYNEGANAIDTTNDLKQLSGYYITSDMVMGPPREARKISYVTDTMYFPEIADYVHDSDILFCEGMFEKGLVETAREKKHMTAYEAAMVARDSGSLKLCLQHYSPRYSDRELKVLLKEAQEIFPETVLTKDRMSFDIPLDK